LNHEKFKKKIFYIENSKKEILEAVIEFEKKIYKKNVKKIQFNFNQKKFWKIYLELYKKYNYEVFSPETFTLSNAKSFVISKFLKKNQYLLK